MGKILLPTRRAVLQAVGAGGLVTALGLAHKAHAGFPPLRSGLGREPFNVPTYVFNYYIAPNGDDNNDGLTPTTAWSITALNTKQSTYRGTNVGIIGDVGGTQTPITYGTVGGVQSTLYSLMNSAGSGGNQPVLNPDGGTASSSTVLASCDSSGVYRRGWAIIDCSSSGTYSSNGSGIVFGQSDDSATQVPHPGYITYDGLIIRYFTYAAIQEMNAAGAVLQNVVVKNCELYNGLCPTSANNPGAVRFWNVQGMQILNNYVHDLAVNGGGASPVWGFSAFMCYGTAGASIGIICKNNTTQNCSSFLTKNYNQDFADCSYNYFDHGNFGSAANTDGDLGAGCIVGHQPYSGVVSNIHHNIFLGPVQSSPQSSGVTLTGTINLYNNTFYGTPNYASFESLYCHDGGPGNSVQFQHNIVYATNGYDSLFGLFVETATVNIANATFNDNVYGSGMQFSVVDDVNLGPLSTWQSNTSCDASSTSISSAPFTGTPTAITPSSFATNSLAIIGGVTCGALDGSGTIGCSFA